MPGRVAFEHPVRTRAIMRRPTDFFLRPMTSVEANASDVHSYLFIDGAYLALYGAALSTYREVQSRRQLRSKLNIKMDVLLVRYREDVRRPGAILRFTLTNDGPECVVDPYWVEMERRGRIELPLDRNNPPPFTFKNFTRVVVDHDLFDLAMQLRAEGVTSKQRLRGHFPMRNRGLVKSKWTAFDLPAIYRMTDERQAEYDAAVKSLQDRGIVPK